jgi:hypothetical protein
MRLVVPAGRASVRDDGASLTIDIPAARSWLRLAFVQTFSFGSGIDQREAFDIVRLIRDRFPQLGR